VERLTPGLAIVRGLQGELANASPVTFLITREGLDSRRADSLGAFGMTAGHSNWRGGHSDSRAAIGSRRSRS
jgi:hypothetical protein